MHGSVTLGIREDWFPTSIWYFDLPESAELNRRLAELIQAERTADLTGLAGRSSVLGWHSADDLQRRLEFAGFFEMASQCIAEVVTFLRWDSNRVAPQLLNAWACVNPPGASNALHNHPQSLLSGVYYVSAPEQSGALTFRDPREAATMFAPPVTEQTHWTFQRIAYPPQTGRLLIFPSWLLHGVEPNLSREDRIAISFNVGTQWL